MPTSGSRDSRIISNRSLSRRLLKPLKCEPITIRAFCGAIDALPASPTASRLQEAAAIVLNLWERLDFPRYGSFCETFSFVRDCTWWLPPNGDK